MLEFYDATEKFLALIAVLGTHILFATLGGILCEKVGNLNLGLEGLLLMGAAFGATVGYYTGNPLLAILASGAMGAFGALIYAFLTVSLKANQVVTGLTLTIFGTGLSGLIGAGIAGKPLPGTVTSALGAFTVPVLEKIPLLGPVFFRQSPFVIGGILAAVLLAFFYNRTSVGLNARMVGENPAAADASGINVTRYKYLCILAGGALCGIGGGFFCMSYAGYWQKEITAGAGWIAIALVIFTTWKPMHAIWSAYLFGAIRGIAFKLQSGIPFFGHTLTVSSAILDMAPYAITILVLILITIRKKRDSQPPSALSVPYFREER